MDANDTQPLNPLIGRDDQAMYELQDKARRLLEVITGSRDTALICRAIDVLRPLAIEALQK